MAADQKQQSKTRMVTGKTRLSYAHIFTAKPDDNGVLFYSTAVLIPKSDKETLKKFEACVAAAIAEGVTSKWGGKKPKDLQLPLRDGDEEVDEKGPAYAGHWFFNTKSKTQPGVVDRGRNEILDANGVVSGDYRRVSINLYPFDTKGNKGVAVGLGNVQLIEKGEPLSGRTRPEDDFDEIDEDDDFLG